MLNRRELLTGGAYALTAAAFSLAVGPTLYRKFLEYKNEDELRLGISLLQKKIFDEYGVNIYVNESKTGIIDKEGNKTLTSKPMQSLYFQLMALEETYKQIQIYPPDTLAKVINDIVISDVFIYQKNGIKPFETTIINSLSSDGKTLFFIATRGRALNDDIRIMLLDGKVMEGSFIVHEFTHSIEVVKEKEVEEKFKEILQKAKSLKDYGTYEYFSKRDREKDVDENTPRPNGFANHYGRSFYFEDFATVGELVFGAIKYTKDMDDDEILQMKIKYVKEKYEEVLNLPKTYWGNLKSGIVGREYWIANGRIR